MDVISNMHKPTGLAAVRVQAGAVPTRSMGAPRKAYLKDSRFIHLLIPTDWGCYCPSPFLPTTKKMLE